MSLFLVLLALAPIGGSAQNQREHPTNGEVLYAACSAPLVAGSPLAHCVSTAAYVLMDFARSDGEGGDLMFCLPRNSPVSVENVMPLIEAYRSQYSRDPRAFRPFPLTPHSCAR